MKELTTIDADTLFASPMQKTEFLVENLLPQGTHIFCGSAKIGKSWLILWLCLQVARGGPLWDCKTTKSDVLYLCLEDTHTRIQQRLHYVTDNAPENLRFAILCNKIGEGLEEQLEAYLQSYPQTKLVVIDTLQKVRSNVNLSNAYGSDYEEIGRLKHLADKYSLSIVLVHHLRKLADKDPFNQVSGSTGITGSVDSVLLLKRDSRTSDFATLMVTGRDTPYQELSLQFENYTWELVEKISSEEVRQLEIPEFIFRVVAFAKLHKSWSGTASELLLQMSEKEIKPNIATKYLSQFYYEILQAEKISYLTHRTGKCRTITLFCDDNDSNDDKTPCEKTSSQSSLSIANTI